MSGIPGGNEAMLRVMEYVVLALGVVLALSAGVLLAMLIYLGVFA